VSRREAQIALALHQRPANDNAQARAAKARKSQRSGKAGEKTVAEYNATAQAAGVAVLHKVPTDTRWTPRGMVYTTRSTVDFVGFMLDGTGRHLAVEVKTCTSKKTFSLGEVEPHQRDYLDAVEAAGGVAALVVVYGKEHAVCAIPWHLAKDRASLNEQAVRIFQVTPATYLRRFLDTRLEIAG
jgi:penicillin-binding protein-related factor A (putative recombinase)